jgi:hypothetical protein
MFFSEESKTETHVNYVGPIIITVEKYAFLKHFQTKIVVLFSRRAHEQSRHDEKD